MSDAQLAFLITAPVRNNLHLLGELNSFRDTLDSVAGALRAGDSADEAQACCVLVRYTRCYSYPMLGRRILMDLFVSWQFVISIPTWRRQSAKRPSMQQGEGEGLFLSPWTQYCQGLRKHPSFRCVVF